MAKRQPTAEEWLAAFPKVYEREGNFVTVNPPRRQDGDELDPVPYSDRTDFNAGQMPIWLAKQRHLFMIAGSKGGKSHIGPPWLDRAIRRTTARHPRIVSEFAIVGPTLQDLMSVNVGLGRMARYYWETQGWDEDTIFNKRFLSIDLTKVGVPAVIYSAAESRMHRLQGKHLSAIWIDEGGQFRSELGYIEAVGRLGKDGQVLLTTTPYIEGRWLKERVDAAKEGDPEDDILVVRYPSIVNYYFPYEEWLKKQRDLPPPYFNMFHRAMFELPLGLVYPNVSYCEPFTIPPSWERILAVDPSHGGPDPIAGLWIAIDPNPPHTWYAYREYYQSCRPPVSNWRKEQVVARQPWDLLEEIKEASLYERWVPPILDAQGRVIQEGYFHPTGSYEHISRIFYDPGSSWVETWLEEHYPDSLVFRPDKTRNAGLIDTGSMLQRGEEGGLVVFNTLAYWRWERDHYAYPTDIRGDTTSADPVKNDDHLMDCTRYAVRQCAESWQTADFSIGGWRGVS